ncbi:MAG: NirD/YgiW/YdeI family stress tolerance protein [Alphaproteobacteria bacterium]|nr:NirD/YgiW/YdeI family stress tolerance protein [Alphaproteobacteria bacterium]
MKKIILTLLAIFSTVSVASAQMGGGFEGPSATKNETTVAEALKMRDETYVTLTGKIVNSLGDEKYTFKDETGEVVVEIDDEDWRGIKVTPENTITINGEVDKEMFEPTKIDVDSVVVK